MTWSGTPPSSHREPASRRRSWKCRLIARSCARQAGVSPRVPLFVYSGDANRPVEARAEQRQVAIGRDEPGRPARRPELLDRVRRDVGDKPLAEQPRTARGERQRHARDRGHLVPFVQE